MSTGLYITGIILLSLSSATIGAHISNMTLLKKYREGLSTIYLTWIVVKRSAYSLIAFLIYLAILSWITEAKIWQYLSYLIYPVINYFYVGYIVNEEYDIMFKPG